MRALAIVRVVVAAGIIAGAVALAEWGGLRGEPQLVLKAVHDQAGDLSRGAMDALAVAAPLVLLLALARLIRRNRTAPAQVLSLIGALAPLAGTVTAVIVLGALLARILAVHAARPALAGPLLAEAALVLGLGLLVGGLATLPKGAGWNGGEP